tara:strand:+ start:1154 stop:1537 length:384 start_codon:yes stop_codon:yes gene_type:complete
MADYCITQSFIAASAITEFALVSIDGNGKVAVTTSSSDKKCIGVAQRAASTGEAVDVIIFGPTRVIAGGSITFTDSLVMATTSGNVATHASSGNYAIGRIIPNINQTSASANDQLSIVFTGPNNLIP